MTYNNILKGAKHISQVFGSVPLIGIVCGSGMKSAFSGFNVLHELDFRSIAGCPIPTALGHHSSVQVIQCGENRALLFGGRCHFYEGYTVDEVCFQVELMHALGCTHLIQTNAVGGISRELSVGDVAFVNGVIDLTSIPRKSHKSSSSLFSEPWMDRTALAVKEDGNTELKTLTYAQVTGPTYETRAEVGMLNFIGADCVGMSSGFEARCAASLGMANLMVSVVTNLHAKEGSASTSHVNVVQEGIKASRYVGMLIKEACDQAFL